MAPIAEHLRIRLPFLEAIEDGRTADLPGAAYAIGFLRSYAAALGLDADEISRRFREEVQHVGGKTRLNFPAPVPERGVPAGVVVLLGVLLVVGAYGGWYKFSSSGRPEFEAVQPVPPRLLALTEAPRLPSEPVPAVQVVQPTAAAAAAPGAPSVVVAAPVQAADGTRIVVRARSEIWIQVRDPKGPVVLNRVLRAGETWPVPPKVALLLTTGNAGGTELLVDGVLAPSLGAEGVVRRDILLDPDPIRDGKLTPPPPAARPVPTTRPNG